VVAEAKGYTVIGRCLARTAQAKDMEASFRLLVDAPRATIVSQAESEIRMECSRRETEALDRELARLDRALDSYKK
jgi:hypothetical protein